MATRRNDKEPKKKKQPPATTPDSRENQLIAQAIDLAEAQIAEGTASSQVISHFLKLASSRERLEQERIRHENKLLEAKAEAMASQARVEELYREALNAMRSYAGQEPLPVPIDVED